MESTDQTGPSVMKQNQHQVMRSILIALEYLIPFILLDLLTKQFEGLPGIVTWYPPAGLTYALLLVFGVRFTPAVTIALFLSSVFIYRLPHPPLLLLLWSFVVSLIYAATAWFLRHRIHLDCQLRKLRDVAWLVGTAVLVSAFLAILTVSSSTLDSAMPRSEVLRGIFHWWIGEAVGVLTVTPFLLVYVMPWLKRFVDGQSVSVPKPFSFPGSALTFIGQAASLVLILYWVFGTRVLDEFRPFFLLALPLIWIALNRGFKKLTVAILALNFGVVLSTWLFGFDVARLAELELLMIVICMVGLLMGAVVTERKGSEDATRESEERYRTLIEQASDGIFISDNEDRFIEVNSAGCQLLGYSHAEILQKTIRDITKISPDNQFYTNELRQGKTLLNERELIRKDGTLVSVEISAKHLPDGRLQGIVRDITQRKHVQEELQESQKLLEKTFSSLLDALFIIDADTLEIVDCNPAASTIFGYSRQEMLSQTTMFLHVDQTSLEKFSDHLNTAVKEKGFLFMPDFWMKRKDGTVFPTENSVVPLENEQGKLTGWVSVVRDITERKQAEDNQKRSEERFKVLFESAPYAYYLCDLKGNFLDGNIAAEKLLGYAKNELIGKNFLKLNLLSLIQIPKAVMLITKNSLGQDTGPDEFEIRRKDGKKVIVAISTHPEIINDQAVVLGLVIDLTERKQAEEEIKNRNEELSVLYTLSRILADADDLEHVINLVNHHAAESLQTTFASIALLENDKLVMRGIYPVRDLEHGELDVNPQPIASLPYVMGVLEKNEPVILHAENARISSSERTFLRLDIVQSTCLVPLRVGSSLQVENTVLGLLVLGESRGNERAPFTPEKIQLARSIGDQAASAIRRMLVIEQASLRLQRITSLREIDTTIAASFDIRLSLEVILKYVLEQLGVDAVAVLVVNSSQQRLEYKGGRGFRSQAIEHMGQRLDEGQAGLSLRERRMIYIQNVTASGASFAQSELMEAEQFCVYIAMPLIVKGKANGVLEIYNRSPLDPDEEWFDFLNTLAGQTALAIDTDQLFYGLQRSNIELGLAYDATIEGWSHALDLRDNETEGHSKRVTETTVKLAHSFNLSNENLKQIRWGALLHDIGKLGVPDGILLKPGPLTEEEWVVMKKHPTLAFEMLSPIQYLKASLDIPYCHHEKWDGTGYPRGIKGEQIPLAARIFAVVDVWDALISDRPYRKAWTQENALNHIQDQSGTHFDPQVVKVFLKEISNV